MSWPKVLAFYAIALMLTFHLLGVTRERAGVSETKAPTVPFLEAVPERIDRVRLENETLAVQFERKGERWVTTEPEGLAPPGDVIDAVLDSFATLPAIEIIADGSEREDQFGFVPPRMRIRLEQEGALVSTIVLGELSPTRTAVYARKSGSDEVALIGLNAKYYIDLIFENVRRQRSSAGIQPPPEAAPVAAPPGVAPGAIPPGAVPPVAPAAAPPVAAPPGGEPAAAPAAPRE